MTHIDDEYQRRQMLSRMSDGALGRSAGHGDTNKANPGHTFQNVGWRGKTPEKPDPIWALQEAKGQRLTRKQLAAALGFGDVHFRERDEKLAGLMAKYERNGIVSTHGPYYYLGPGPMSKRRIPNSKDRIDFLRAEYPDITTSEIRVLTVLMSHPEAEMTRKELRKKSKLGGNNTDKILKYLQQRGFIHRTPQIGIGRETFYLRKSKVPANPWRTRFRAGASVEEHNRNVILRRIYQGGHGAYKK